MDCRRCHLKLSIDRSRDGWPICEHCETRGFVPLHAALDFVDEAVTTLRGCGFDEIAERLLAVKEEMAKAEIYLRGKG